MLLQLGIHEVATLSPQVPLIFRNATGNWIKLAARTYMRTYYLSMQGMHAVSQLYNNYSASLLAGGLLLLLLLAST